MLDEAGDNKEKEDAYRAEQRRIRLARQSADVGFVGGTRRVLLIALVVAGINVLASIWYVPGNALTDYVSVVDPAASAVARREADPSPFKKEKRDARPSADADKARDSGSKDEGTLTLNTIGSVYLIRVTSSLSVFALILLGALIALRNETDR